MRSDDGRFTPIEAVVVVFILALTAAVVFPRLDSDTVDRRRAVSWASRLAGAAEPAEPTAPPTAGARRCSASTSTAAGSGSRPRPSQRRHGPDFDFDQTATAAVADDLRRFRRSRHRRHATGRPVLR